MQESFDDGVGIFNRVWGEVDTSIPGQITLTSPADSHADAGAMVPPTGPEAGFGYGTYSFTLALHTPNVGPYALLWPGTDHWPGPELDVMEGNGGKTFSTVHWSDTDGNDQAEWQWTPDIDPQQIHTYSLNWQPNQLDFSVDGVIYRTETDKDYIPRDYDDGGQNLAPSVGMLTHWWPDLNTVDNSMTVYQFDYIG